MKRKFFSFFSLLISLTLIWSFFSIDSYAVEKAPNRVINVVYDDSGSMITNGAAPVDTWCQAKYSMEVFAALMGKNDTMNVYVMSDYDGMSASRPRLTLKGSDGAERNVKAVHDMLTFAGNTPFDAVRKAYDDLTTTSADEKWLVILTDGEFEDGQFTSAQVDEYFSHKADDINVMFLSMGEEAATIKANEAEHLYFEKAQTNDQILNKLTGISTRIFNSNKLEVDASSGKFNFDIPMSEFIVFAQGDGVRINSITGNDQEISYDRTPVSVKYSEQASAHTDRYLNFVVDYELVGSVATFTGDFMPGKYRVNAENAKTIEVYYKPNVEIMLYLTDENGDETPYVDGVRAGEYKLNFGFVKAGTSEPVEESKLLGDITYAATVSFNGNDSGKIYKPGDDLTIEEGNYVIDAYADYLKYNSVSTQISFDVFRDKELILKKIEDREYQLDVDGFQNADEPIRYEVTLEGAALSAEDWAAFENPTITVNKSLFSENRVELYAEKSDTPGVFNIYPKLTEEKPSIGSYGNVDYKVSISSVKDRSNWTGIAEDTCNINDIRPAWRKHLDIVIKISISLGILFFFLGYIPGIKKYLPKKLQRTPHIDCESTGYPTKVWTAPGSYNKMIFYSLVPYMAERGYIRYTPKGVSGATQLQIKAIGNQKMEISNTKSFVGKEHILFDGEFIPVDFKGKLKKGGGLTMTVMKPEAKYECSLSRKWRRE